MLQPPEGSGSSAELSWSDVKCWESMTEPNGCKIKKIYFLLTLSLEESLMHTGVCSDVLPLTSSKSFLFCFVSQLIELICAESVSAEGREKDWVHILEGLLSSVWWSLVSSYCQHKLPVFLFLFFLQQYTVPGNLYFEENLLILGGNIFLFSFLTA